MEAVISKLYLIPTSKCNLHCNHCKQYQDSSIENHLKFLDAASKIDFNEGIIFGGEPLLTNDDFLRQLCLMPNVKSISTNLLLLNDCHLKLFKEYNLDVATSWNPSRFDSKQLSQWLSNVRTLKKRQLYVTVLITLTDDLVLETKRVIDLLDQLNQIGQLKIKFEPYVPSSQKLIKASDVWLVEISRRWKWANLQNEIFLQYANGNIFNCKDVWSLYPDGSLKNSCPTGKNKVILEECCRCQYANICKPCIKQTTCSLFKKFYEYVKTTN